MRGGAGDWLVGQLQQLIDVGFRMATGPTEALKPLGLRLLRTLLLRFGAAEDPLLEGARLLEQNQAQFVSALRRAFLPSAPQHSGCTPRIQYGMQLSFLLREHAPALRLSF